jgi:hypothetical protein
MTSLRLIDDEEFLVLEDMETINGLIADSYTGFIPVTRYQPNPRRGHALPRRGRVEQVAIHYIVRYY